MDALILLLDRLLILGFSYCVIKLILIKFNSIRALATIMISCSFCFLAIAGKIQPKDVLLITSLVYNFYFLVKDRTNKNGG